LRIQGSRDKLGVVDAVAACAVCLLDDVFYLLGG
jgi:hypothetical protein